MRIALASWEAQHSIAVGGVAVHVSELAVALTRRGHEVHLFTRMGPGQLLDECIDDVWYHRCPQDSPLDFLGGIHEMCAAFLDRFDAIQRIVGPFDVFHAHDWLTVEAMLEAQRRYGIPGVLTMHSTEYGRCGNDFHGGASDRIREIEQLGVSHADGVIAVSRTLCRELSWIYGAADERVRVIYNGVSPSAFGGHYDPAHLRQQLEIDASDPIVLFVGRMTCQKGPDLLLRAVPSVLTDHKNAKFLFVGEGDLRWGMEEEAREMGVSSACRFLGYKSGVELTKLYHLCDAVAVPSRNEPFGIVILEAWSAGKPVVATVNGGPSEFVWHGVTGLKIHDQVDSVAWGINEMLGDLDRARWMGHHGRVAVETVFSWDQIALQTESAYTDVLTQVGEVLEPMSAAI